MKKSKYTLISLLLLAGLYCAASVSYALDAPHNDVGSVVCDNCHYPSTAVPTWASAPSPTGSTPLNELCVTCHYSLNGALSSKFADVKTHSSYNTDPTSTGSNIYLMECINCHNPHLQDQMRANPLLGDMDAGTTTSVDATSLTDGAKTWTVDQFKDALLIPNTAYTAYSYRIVSNTPTTLTVTGPMKTTAPFTGAGKPYSIKYGKLIRQYVVTPSGAASLVTFLGNSGPNSFATSTTVITGICQVCHTKTTSFTNTGTLAGPTHVQNAAGTNCTGCHLHKEGFKGSGCNACHGKSGGTGAPLISSDLVTPATGHDEGKHAKHVLSLNQGCQVCHAGTTMPSLDSSINGELQWCGIGRVLSRHCA